MSAFDQSKPDFFWVWFYNQRYSVSASERIDFEEILAVFKRDHPASFAATKGGKSAFGHDYQDTFRSRLSAVSTLFYALRDNSTAIFGDAWKVVWPLVEKRRRFYLPLISTNFPTVVRGIPTEFGYLRGEISHLHPFYRGGCKSPDVKRAIEVLMRDFPVRCSVISRPINHDSQF